MKGMCKIQEFIYIRKKLRESAKQLNEVIDTVLKKYKVKAEIKQKLLNTANLSVVLKTEDNKSRWVIKMKKLKNNANFTVGNNHLIQSKIASDFLKKEQLIVALLIKEGVLKETCCGDCFVVQSEQKETLK